MNRSTFLFTVPFIFFYFLGWSNSDADIEGHFGYSSGDASRFVLEIQEPSSSRDNV